MRSFGVVERPCMTVPHASADHARINELRELLARANTAYYVDAAPFMSDQEFDTLLAELVSLEARNPALFDANSPTQRVGGAPLEGEFETRAHRVPMLSVDNTYSIEELRVWYQRCADGLGAGSGDVDPDAGLFAAASASAPTLFADPKVDGLAISLR